MSFYILTVLYNGVGTLLASLLRLWKNPVLEKSLEICHWFNLCIITTDLHRLSWDWSYLPVNKGSHFSFLAVEIFS
jgi:hypothetical protein